MNLRALFAIWMPLTFAAAGVAATTAPTNAPAVTPVSSTEASAFKIISDRNIFNPNRYARTVRTTERPRERTPQTRVEHVALVGTLTYEKGQLAFFDGTSSELRRPLKQSDTVVGYRLVEIMPDRVRLGAGTNHFDLPVGKELRRDDGGEWTIADQVEITTSYNSSSGSERGGRSFGRSLSGGAAPVVHTNEAPAMAAGPADIIFDEPGEPPPGPPPGVNQLIVNEQALAPAAGEAAPAAASPAPAGDVNPVLLRLMQQRQQEENR